MMAVDFSPPLAWRSKYLTKTDAKQFLFRRAIFSASASVESEKNKRKRERKRGRKGGRKRVGGRRDVKLIKRIYMSTHMYNSE